MLTRLSFLRRTLGAAFAGFLLTRPEPAEPMGLVAALDGAPDLWLRWLDQVDTFEELRGLRPTHFRCSHETMAELCKSFPVFSPLVGNKLRGVEWVPDSTVPWGLFEMVTGCVACGGVGEILVPVSYHGSPNPTMGWIPDHYEYETDKRVPCPGCEPSWEKLLRRTVPHLLDRHELWAAHNGFLDSSRIAELRHRMLAKVGWWMPVR